MFKALGFSLTGLCVLATVLDTAWRAFGALTLTSVTFGSGVFVVVLAAAPFFMKPTDADINDIGIIHVDDEDDECSVAQPHRASA